MELSMMTFMLEFPVLFFKPGTKEEKAKEIETFIELTAETGYTLSNVTVYVGGVNKTNDYYSNGVVSVPAGATVRGDIVITATAG